MLTGETDFLLKIVAADWDSYQRFLSAKLTSAPNVSHVKSALTLRVSKDEPGIPIADQPVLVDDDELVEHRSAGRFPMLNGRSAVSGCSNFSRSIRRRHRARRCCGRGAILANPPFGIVTLGPGTPDGCPGRRLFAQETVAALDQ